MAKLCENRVCIVTGGARGLGRDYALMLAEHGAKVVVNDLGGTRDGVGAELGPAEEVVAEIRKAGGEAVANGADVSDFQQAKAMIQQAVDTFGRLDVLINNAGILRDRMLVNMTEAEWDVVIKVHLRGTFAPAHHAAAYWRDQAKAGIPSTPGSSPPPRCRGSTATWVRPTMEPPRPASPPSPSSRPASSSATESPSTASRPARSRD